MRGPWALLLTFCLAGPAAAQDSDPAPSPPPPACPQPLLPPPPPPIFLAPIDEPCFPARAPEPEPLQMVLGYRTWLSQGRSVTSTAGPGGVPNVMSELTWSRLNNAIQEFRLEAALFDRFLANVSIGGGTAGSGRLRDQDFDGNDRTDLYSDTDHPADAGDLALLTLDLGCRVLDVGGPRLRWTFDLLAGYLFWQEHYVAHGGQARYPDAWVFPDGPVITNTFQWHALRLGGRSELHVASWLLGTGLFLLPINAFHNNDVHHLRDDLYQDPSFRDQATGGFGVTFEVTAAYRVWRGLFVETGYRIWAIEAGKGTTASFAPDGTGVSDLHGARSLRQGLLLGLNYRF